ncbi:MAG: PPC domain-containing protein [Alkalispirochaetaceae bacterium]
MYKSMILGALFTLLLLSPAVAQEDGEVLFSTENELGPGDQTVSDGSFVDYYQVQVEEGERVAIVVSSEEFDSYLYVTLPDGTQESNDDYVDWNAGFEFIAEESGTVEFGVSSLFSGETGEYSVRVVSLPEPTELEPGSGWTLPCSEAASQDAGPTSISSPGRPASGCGSSSFRRSSTPFSSSSTAAAAA